MESITVCVKIDFRLFYIKIDWLIDFLQYKMDDKVQYVQYESGRNFSKIKYTPRSQFSF